MHMADALLSPAVGVTMCAVSAGAVAYSAAKVKKDELGEKKLPVMAVAGAFVFASQMINFTIPATGSSGHIGGGVLLAALLGDTPPCSRFGRYSLSNACSLRTGESWPWAAIFQYGRDSLFTRLSAALQAADKDGVFRQNLSTASILSVVVVSSLARSLWCLKRLFPASPCCRSTR
jgi:cobalt/nickel transport system permease protein